MLCVGLPSSVRNSYRSPTREAFRNVRWIHDGSVAYFAPQKRFPRSSPLTPGIDNIEAACGDRRALRTRGWDNNSTWDELGFELLPSHLHAHQYDSSGFDNTAEFTASAFADLDCDGVFSTFMRFGTVVDMEVRDDGGVYIANELD